MTLGKIGFEFSQILRSLKDIVVRGVLSATPRISIQLGTLKNAVHVKTGMIFLPGLQASR